MGLFLVQATSCKKEDKTDAAAALIGTWKVHNSGNLVYIVFDGSGITHSLENGPYNLHQMSASPYTADGEYITTGITSSGVKLYRYRFSGDTLRLSQPGAEIVLTKNSPINPAEWVKTVRLGNGSYIGNGYRFGSLDWDGTHFIISNYINKYLYKFNPASAQLTDSSVIFQKATALATIGTDIWVNNLGTDTKLRKIDFATALSLQTSANAPGTPQLMAANGSDIWFFADDSKLYSYNTLSDAFTLQASLPGFPISASGGPLPPDMVFVNGKIWIGVYNYILCFDPVTAQVIDTYRLEESRFMCGIAHNGTDFYVLSIDALSALDEIDIRIHKLQF